MAVIDPPGHDASLAMMPWCTIRAALLHINEKAKRMLKQTNAQPHQQETMQSVAIYTDKACFEARCVRQQIEVLVDHAACKSFAQATGCLQTRVWNS